MEENKNGSFDEQPMELSPEIKALLEKDQENRKKLAEIFSQCWDDEGFKKNFIANPKAVMDEYGVEYDKTKDFKIVDSKEKTITYVLPYENIKQTLEALGKAFEQVAEQGSDTRKIIPDGWTMEFIQNTIDTNYIVIPVNPETLTPEELEMVNGGCFFIAALVFIVTTVAVAGVAVVAGVAFAVGVIVGAVAIAAAGGLAYHAAVVGNVAAVSDQVVVY